MNVTGRIALPVAIAAAAAIIGLSRATAGSPIPSPDVVVVVNAQNPARLTLADLEAIFLMERRTWGDGTPIVPFSYPASAPLRLLFDRAVLHFSADQAARYWLDQRIRTGLRPPRQVPSPPLAARLVVRLKGAVAFIPEGDLVPGLRVVARIHGGRLFRERTGESR